MYTIGAVVIGTVAALEVKVAVLGACVDVTDDLNTVGDVICIAGIGVGARLEVGAVLTIGEPCTSYVICGGDTTVSSGLHCHSPVTGSCIQPDVSTRPPDELVMVGILGGLYD